MDEQSIVTRDSRLGIRTSSDDSPISSLESRPLALLRLCQLVSPALPVGAYHFSQGLEYAVQAGWVRDEDSAFEWIADADDRLGPVLEAIVNGRYYWVPFERVRRIQACIGNGMGWLRSEA